MAVSLLRVIGPAVAVLNLLSASPGLAQEADDDGQGLVHFNAGDTLTLYGQDFHARKRGVAYVALSSEYLSVAVLSGRLSADNGHSRIAADAGEILIRPIEGRRTERFLYDAQKLIQTMGPERTEAESLLQPIIKQQHRQRFFGLIEPVGLNAQTPAAGLENLRREYISRPVIVDLRHQAGGNMPKLNQLTAERFVTAVSARDAATVADLLDPKPFTDATADPQAWQAARGDFAGRLIAQPDLAVILANQPVTADPQNAGSYLIGTGYRLRIANRDRAAFVAALEPIQ